MDERQQEEWRDAPGHAGFYQVSNWGRVKSLGRVTCHGHRLRERLLKLANDGNGYPLVVFYKNRDSTQRRVHQLVLEAFVGHSPDGAVCRHLNGNPADNRVENLRWGTRKENAQDSLAHGAHVCGERHKHSKLTESDIGEILVAFGTCEDVGKMYGVSRSAVSLIRRNERWKHLRQVGAPQG